MIPVRQENTVSARPRSAGAHYALMQGLYWATMAVGLAFGAAYLYSLGFNSGQTGVVLMLTCLLSSLLQPVLASWADRSGRPGAVRRLSILLLLPAALLLLAVWLLPIRLLPRVCLYVLAWTLLWTVQFLISSMAMEYENARWNLNFGACRACGSLAYALAAYLYGFVADGFGAGALLPVGVLLCTLLLICTILWRAPGAPAAPVPSVPRSEPAQRGGFLSRYPRFILLTAGAALCLMPYCAAGNYQVRIVESVGGGSVQLGTLVMIAALCEMPVMLLLLRLVKRFGSYRLVLLAAVMFTGKMVALCLADTVPLLYAAQALQLLSYPLFVSVSVLYVNERMDAGDRVRGQSLMGLTQTLGSAAGSLLGGLLLDRLSVHGMLLVCTLVSVAGTVVMAFGAERVRAVPEPAPQAGPHPL